MLDFTLIVRKLRNERTFSILILATLVLAFSVAIPLVCNISYHLSFDRFHKDYNKIYNVYSHEVYHGTKDLYGELPLAFGENIHKLFPEVEKMVRTKDLQDALVSADNNQVWKEDILWADSSFRDLFRLEVIAGNTGKFLLQPDEAYISISLSQKIFGTNNPSGKEININGSKYSVAGVFKDYPKNSFQKFDVLLPLKRFVKTDERYKWDNYEFLTFVKLKGKSDPRTFERKLKSFIEQYWVPWVKKNYNMDYVFSKENSVKLCLLPVADIHLKSSSISSFDNQSKMSVLYTNFIIILVIILIAYFNILGFAISKNKKHQLQISVRRFLGASRKNLFYVFITENIMFTCIAFLASFIIVYVSWKMFPLAVSGKGSITIFSYLYPVLLLFISVLFIAALIGFTTGQIFNKISKNQNQKKFIYSGFWLNRAMFVFQMAVSFILLIGIVTVFKQMHFISSYPSGIDTKNVVIISHANRIRNNIQAFKTELKKSPLIKNVSCSNSYPFNWLSTESYAHVNPNNQVPYPFLYISSDIEFQKIFNFKLNHGEWFTNEHANQKNGIIINEEAVKVFGLKIPIGEEFYQIDSPYKKYKVVGVVENFNFQSLHHKIMPFLLFPANEKDYWNFIEIKGASADREKLINQIKYVWGRIAGETFLDYTFLEDKTALLYQKEQSMKRSLSIFSVIAIIISCLGLLGTVLNTTTEKTKEIGIRKVNGAQVQDVLYLLNKDFIHWILLSFLIAVPIALYLMNQWLQNFAYKTELSWWLFALSGIMIMTIALLTVSFQSWKAASGNPVEALRYE